MRRENQRALQKTAGEHAAKMAVPCMTVNDVDIVKLGAPLEVNVERLEKLLQSVIVRVQSQLARKAQGTDIVLVFVLHAKAARLDVAKLRKFLRQELNMDTCAAINFRREFVRQNCCIHNLVDGRKLEVDC